MSDIVDSQMKLLDHLGVRQLHAVVGASIGGFLSLLTATRYPDRVRIVLPVGTGVETTIYQRIINFEQVNAIEADPNFRGGDYYAGARPDLGLALARRIAHKTFVSLDDLRERARTEIVSQKPPYGWYEMNHPVESYMLHQGEKFVRRFDANTLPADPRRLAVVRPCGRGRRPGFQGAVPALPPPGVPGLQHRFRSVVPPAGTGKARPAPEAGPRAGDVDHRALGQGTRCLPRWNLASSPPTSIRCSIICGTAGG